MYVLRKLFPKLERRATDQLMRCPRPADGSNPASWINHTELYVDGPVFPKETSSVSRYPT